MTAVASEGVPVTQHRLQQRLRAAVLGPHDEAPPGGALQALA
jgi:hypothetical protein